MDEYFNDQWSEDEESSESSSSDSESTLDEESEDDCSSDGETYYYMFPEGAATNSAPFNVENENGQVEISYDHRLEWDKNGVFSPLFENYETSQAQFHIPSIDENSTALQVFTYFVSYEEVNAVCEQSNMYVQQTKVLKPDSFKGFKEIEVNEFYRFLALELLMGLVQKPSIKDYWSTNPLYETPIFGRTMSRNRFEEILRAVHFCDNASCDFKINRMLKLGAMVPSLMKKFEEAITPGRNLCVDESLTKFKGRLSFKQYMPKKRARFGVKLFVMADCSTNFVLNAIPYQGETTQLLHPPSKPKNELGYGGSVVHSLVDPYLDSDRIVFVDNWFNSPTLANLLGSRRTGIVGTVRRHRKGMPLFETKLKKGEVEIYTNSALLVERWQDRREVVMLNNCIAHDMINVAKAEKDEKTKPASILAYNKSMGAVDELDKILQPYVAQRKSIKWYKKLWFHFVDITVYNSRIVFNSFKPPKQKLPYKLFLEALISELVLANPVERQPKGRPVNISTSEARLVGRNHFPVKMFCRDSHGHRTEKPQNRRCHLCSLKGERHEGPYACGTCKLHLCITHNKSCFEEYHSIRKLPVKKCFKKAPADRSHYY